MPTLRFSVDGIHFQNTFFCRRSQNFSRVRQDRKHLIRFHRIIEKTPFSKFSDVVLRERGLRSLFVRSFFWSVFKLLFWKNWTRLNTRKVSEPNLIPWLSTRKVQRLNQSRTAIWIWNGSAVLSAWLSREFRLWSGFDSDAEPFMKVGLKCPYHENLYFPICSYILCNELQWNKFQFE